jgi:methylenetetrahydrofolate dehydrogenase (NADP+)/methenyltetrahydrofolate cyclohydrolase
MPNIDGAIISNSLRMALKEKIKTIRSQRKTHTDPPHLIAILVGSDPASQVYITQKEKACLEVGIHFTLIKMDVDSTTKQVVEQVKYVNTRSDVHGCLVQLPLPKSIDTDAVIMAISPDKDVDCFHPVNIGLLTLNNPRFLPATPYGIQMLLENIGIVTRGKHCVIIGKSLIVGQPLMNLLSLEGGMAATVTCCDKYTENLTNYTKTADILIVAAGVHHLIKDPDMIKEGATVIDVGIHRISDPSKKQGYRLEGDVNYQALKDKAGYITPVPGGVGPMTVVALLYNTYTSYVNHI